MYRCRVSSAEAATRQNKKKNNKKNVQHRYNREMKSGPATSLKKGLRAKTTVRTAAVAGASVTMQASNGIQDEHQIKKQTTFDSRVSDTTLAPKVVKQKMSKGSHTLATYITGGHDTKEPITDLKDTVGVHQTFLSPSH